MAEFIRKAPSWYRRRLIGGAFLSIPILLPILKGFQMIVDWRKTTGIILEVKEEEVPPNMSWYAQKFYPRHKVIYKYAAGDLVIQHTQSRNDLEILGARMWNGPQRELNRGDEVRVNFSYINPKESVHRPYPFALWHLGLFSKGPHPYRGEIIADFRSEEKKAMMKKVVETWDPWKPWSFFKVFSLSKEKSDSEDKS